MQDKAKADILASPEETVVGMHRELDRRERFRLTSKQIKFGLFLEVAENPVNEMIRRLISTLR